MGAILVVALASVVWTGKVYRLPESEHFPRQSSDFRNISEIAAARADALARLSRDADDLGAYVELAIATFERGPDHYIVKDAPMDDPSRMGALQLAEKAIELGALDHRLFYYAGAMYEELRYIDYAIPKYEMFIRHHPDDLETRLRLGNLYYRQENLDKSIDAYRRVLARKPGDQLVSYNLAVALRDAKRWSEAFEALAPFAKDGRNLPTGGHRLLGDVYRGLGDYPKALEEYRAELATSGEALELATAMATALEDIGETDAAAERWEKVLQFDPSNREARARLRKLNRVVPPRTRR